jgi:energy-coupling factor transporter ATP-binding protein EcfA2
MKINEIRLKNFQGLKTYSVGIRGKSVAFTGKNATGKTTLNNAFLWVLFGKDTYGKSLDPKPINPETKLPIMGREPEAEIDFELDNGKTITLSRKQIENWTGKNKPDPVYKGEKGVYEVDGVDVNKKDFDAKVTEIVGDMDIFRLIVDPHSFLGNKDWKERRSMLETLMGGDLRPESVLTESELAILDGREFKDVVSIAKAGLRKAEERASLIPKLVEEAGKAVPISGSEEELRIEITAVMGKIKLEEEKSKDPNLAEKVKEEERERKARAEFETTKQSLLMKKAQLEADIRILSSDLNNTTTTAEMADQRIKHAQEELKKQKTKYREISNETFGDTVCSQCGQEYPTMLRDDLEKKWNNEKAEKLKGIATIGNTHKQNKIQAEQEIETCKKKLNQVGIDREAKLKLLCEVNTAISGLTYTYTPETPKNAVNEEYGSESNKNEVLERLREQEEDLRSRLANIEVAQKQNARIKELETELDELRENIIKLKKIKNTVVEAERKWYAQVEEKANSLFDIIKWKLYEIQKDGEINDICEAVVDGIEYNRTLNTGAKINACIDVSNTFSNFFDKKFPIFIDNAESVTDWKVKPANQTIFLKAQECTNKLTMEELK